MSSSSMVWILSPSTQRLLSVQLPEQRTSSPPWKKRKCPAFCSAILLDSPQASPPVHRFFATCAPGLEAVVAAELRSPTIGALSVEVGSAGVSFQGSPSTGLKANLWLRSAVRVLQELASGSISRSPVYDFVRDAVDWPALLTAESEEPDDEGVRKRFAFRTFDVQARVWDCAKVTNANYASVRSKDAICDAIRDACHGRKPKSPKDTGKMADVPLFLSLFRDKGTLYRDMSGVSLHKRGYRDVMHIASLNEGIAAAILIMAGWHRCIPGFGNCNMNKIWKGGEGSGGPVLLDPMCGSGTILIEAALMASNVAPGLMRTRWPFTTWHDFDSQIWTDCQSQALDAKVNPPQGMRLLGNDIHEGALSLCIRDAKAAGVYDLLELSCQNCGLYNPSIPPSLVVVNPPWGSRLQDDSELIASTWTALGRFLKRSCCMSDLYVLSGNAKATRDLQLKADKKWQLIVGGVNCKLLHYYVLPPKQKLETQEKIEFSMEGANLHRI